LVRPNAHHEVRRHRPPRAHAKSTQGPLRAHAKQKKKLKKDHTGPPRRNDLVAIFADYDGCWDIISKTNPKANTEFWDSKFTQGSATKRSYTVAKGILEDAVTSITHDKSVILFVGSNRQSSTDDDTNAKSNGNGHALGPQGAFEGWAMKYKSIGWTLNKALLSDGDTPFSSWGNARPSPWRKRESDGDLKVRIVENNFKYLSDVGGKIDVFFFDDMAEYLKDVREKATIPAYINLYTVHYSWFEYFKHGTTDPLVAKDVNGRSWVLCDEWPQCDPVGMTI